jgi:hypothetical protein
VKISSFSSAGSSRIYGHSILSTPCSALDCEFANLHQFAVPLHGAWDADNVTSGGITCFVDFPNKDSGSLGTEHVCLLVILTLQRNTNCGDFKFT